MNKIKILIGMLILFLGFFIMYFALESGTKFIFFFGILFGILMSVIGAVIIFTYRYKENMKIVYNYRKAIEELKKDPNNEELIQKAYKYGKELYCSRRSDGIFTKKDKKILEMDIDYARGKLK
ncbi:hypothetical protein SAMN02745883_01024 [Caminicella sporogenes DSM 14501]|uniref:Uncharacterized protein n=1 Tax=Caminicella sporogenes DSM 14501 TaxID=1121266 RepID=A0A1M6NY10_9FIRM|nr:hypothetical protein [Caminicella sporogenes]RKD21600.1 hypothetical protein BET04_07725 [Caminicella sporogenes]WIF94116.1 hypothetical protein QNI18_07315 [Caminicella sporogenes]SHK00627.1 hypothetical protein SAMN02745883_01024 [Caminicella sporogenes DSM 14501]